MVLLNRSVLRLDPSDPPPRLDAKAPLTKLRFWAKQTKSLLLGFKR